RPGGKPWSLVALARRAGQCVLRSSPLLPCWLRSLSQRRHRFRSTAAAAELDPAGPGHQPAGAAAGGGPFPEDASPELESNQITGNLACSANNPAPINDGHPNTVSGTRTGQCAGL